MYDPNEYLEQALRDIDKMCRQGQVNVNRSDAWLQGGDRLMSENELAWGRMMLTKAQAALAEAERYGAELLEKKGGAS
jgi:hypothetical protein